MTRILALLVAVAFGGAAYAATPLEQQSPVPLVQADKSAKPKAKTKRTTKAKKAKKAAPKTK